MITKRNFKKGMTLIETMGVLAIGMTMIAGGIYLFQANQESQSVKNTLTDVNYIYGKLYGAYKARKFKNDWTATDGFEKAKSINAIPKKVATTGKDSFDKDVKVLAKANTKDFAVGVGIKNCKLAVELLNSLADSDWTSYAFQPDASGDFATVQSASTPISQYDPAEAATACSTAATNDEVYVYVVKSL